MNTTEWLEALRQTGMLPSVSENWGDEQILAKGTETLRTRFAKEIINTGSGYWRHQQVVPMVAGTNEYRVNPRATVQGLQKLEISASSAGEWRLMEIVTLGSDGLYESTRTGKPTHFSHYGDYIRVFPTPSDSTYSLRMTFYLSPSKLIPTTDPTDLGEVLSVVSNVVTVGGDVTTFLDSPNGMCDFVNTNGCNEVALFDVPFSTAIAGGGQTVITFPVGTNLSRAAVGQVVRAPDTTDQIPLPRELHDTHATFTAACIQINIGDTTLGEKQAAKAASEIRSIIDLAIPRDKAHPKKLKPRNSWLRRNAGRSWR